MPRRVRSSRTPEPSSPPAVNALIAIGVAFIAALPFLTVGVSRSFINLDDPEYVYQNSTVLNGVTVTGIRWALSSFHAANWHPLTWISHMIDISLFGANPLWHHLTNIGLHASTVALLFLALRRMTGALWLSACVAALFGVHPLRVESVVWIAERKDVLSGLFFALVLLAYERYARRGGTTRYLAVLAFLALGLMAKPMLVTVPCVLLLLDLWPLGRTRLAPSPARSAWQPVPWGKLLAEKMPLLALSAASSLLTIQAQRAFNAIAAPEAIPGGTRIATALVSTVTYLGKTLWPNSLALYYPYPTAGYSWWQAAGAALVLATLTAAALAQLRRRPFLAVGWFWFLGMLIPVIGIVQVGLQAMADRYTYLPQIGLFLIAAWGLPDLLRPIPWGRRVLAGGAIFVVALLGMASAIQTNYWRDGMTLFTRTLALTTGNWVTHTSLGLLLADQGRNTEAAGNLRAAILIRPGYAKAHNNLAVVLGRMGRPEEAVSHYREALRLLPGDIDVQLNLARSLAGLGQSDEAVSRYREVLRARPDSAETHYNLGNVLARLGRYNEAIAHYRESLRLKPDLTDARLNLGNALADSGQLDEALTTYRSVVAMSSGSALAHNNLGNLLVKMKRFEEAVAHYREALRLRPNQKEVLWGLEAALEGLKQREEASSQAAKHPRAFSKDSR